MNLIYRKCTNHGCDCKFQSLLALSEHLTIDYHCPECGQATGELNTSKRQDAGHLCSSCLGVEVFTYKSLANKN